MMTAYRSLYSGRAVLEKSIFWTIMSASGFGPQRKSGGRVWFGEGSWLWSLGCILEEWRYFRRRWEDMGK